MWYHSGLNVPVFQAGKSKKTFCHIADHLNWKGSMVCNFAVTRKLNHISHGGVKMTEPCKNNLTF